MKNFKTTLVKVTMLLAILFVAGVGVNTEAKAKPKLSSKKITINVGQKKKLKVKNTKKKVKWSTKNKAIATVNKKGLVKGKKKGKTTVIAKVGKKSLKCKVTVKKKASSKKSSSKKTDDKKINLSKEVKKQLPYGDDYTTFYYPETLSLGTSTDLFKCVGNAGDTLPTPSNEIKLKYYKWYSSNPSVISIDKYGVATAHKEGKSKVYFKRVNKQGEWVASGTGTITVKNLGNVTYTVAYGLNRDWLDMDPKYLDLNIDRYNAPDAFNYVNVTVTNNSDTEIVVKNEFGLQMGSWKNWTTRDNQSVVVPAKSSKTILYRLTEYGGVRLQREIYRVCLEYSIQNKDNGIYYYPDTNYYEIW